MTALFRSCHHRDLPLYYVDDRSMPLAMSRF